MCSTIQEGEEASHTLGVQFLFAVAAADVSVVHVGFKSAETGVIGLRPSVVCCERIAVIQVW